MPMLNMAKSVKVPQLQECGRDAFSSFLRMESVKKVYADIAALKEQRDRGELTDKEFAEKKKALKEQLPIVTYHATFKNGIRKNENAIPTGLFIMDYDHIGNPKEFYDTHVKEKTKRLNIVLAHVTPSGEGLRIVAVLPPDMEIPQAQKWMADLLAAPKYDACVKDLARPSFMFPESALLFSDFDLLFADDIRAELAKRGIELQKPVFEEPVRSEAAPADIPAQTANVPQTGFPSEYKGTPYSAIIDDWFASNGGKPEEGERHTTLLKLASALRYICDNNPAWLLQEMPSFGLPREEMSKIARDACGYPLKPHMPWGLRQVLNALSDKQSAAELPPLPEKLPQLIELLTSNVPDALKPTVANAVFPALATHTYRVTSPYIDNKRTGLPMMCLLMAASSGGKGCINEPIDYIMADIRARDEENMRKEQAWKDDVNSKGANKDKRKRPELPVQWVNPDMTNAAFVLRLMDANGRFLYTRMNELKMFEALKTNSRTDGHLEIMCLAFDEDSYGQTRVGTQSVTGKVRVRFNWNASTTILQGKQFFLKNLADGPLSRINLCTIPDQGIGADIPVYGAYDEQFAQRLRPYIENLCSAEGEMECPEAFGLAKRLNEECRDIAKERQSMAYDYLRKRAVLIAYRKACLLYLANGQKWEPETEDFIRWSLQYDLACKMMFFGKEMENVMRAETSFAPVAKSRSNLLAKLPDEFTYEDLVRVRMEEGHPEKGAKDLLKQWVHRKYIEVTGDSYKKLR